MKVGLSGELVTPIGTFDIGGDTTLTAIQQQYSQKTLIVRVDSKVSVYPLDQGQQFTVNFDDSNTLYKKVALNYIGDGNIVLELRLVAGGNASPIPPASAPIAQSGVVTNNFYDLPDDGEVLIGFAHRIGKRVWCLSCRCKLAGYQR